MSTVAAPPDQDPYSFLITARTLSGSNPPTTKTMQLSGRYQRWKNVFEYSYMVGIAWMSSRKPIVVCLYVCDVNDSLQMISSSFCPGSAKFLLYSPRTALVSVWKTSSE